MEALGAGLNPLCLSPLVFNAYYTNFVDQVLELEPEYITKSEWISTLVALMVIPGVILSPPIYNKIGLAGEFIMGNIITDSHIALLAKLPYSTSN